MSVPISELLSLPRENLPESKRKQVSLVAPYLQALLHSPDLTDELLNGLCARAPHEAPHYDRKGQEIKILFDPLVTVFGHQIAMIRLADLETDPISSPPARKTDIPILATISPEVMELRKKSLFNAEHDSPFITASMQRLNPYFEHVLEEAMQSDTPYAPVWQKYVELAPQWVDVQTNPQLIEYYRQHEARNPISRLHLILWEGVAPLEMFATNIAPLIYSDEVKTVGQFQQQAINLGAVGILAKAPEIKRPPRNKAAKQGEGAIPSEYFERDPQTGIIRFHDNRITGSEMKPNFVKLLEAGSTMCSAPYGTLDPSPQIQEICQRHNQRMGQHNRSSDIFLLDNKEKVTTIAEEMAYDTLLTAPSTLWLPYLESKGIIDWSDALPGTRLSDGTIMQRRMIEPAKQTTVYTAQ